MRSAGDTADRHVGTSSRVNLTSSSDHHGRLFRTTAHLEWGFGSRPAAVSSTRSQNLDHGGNCSSESPQARTRLLATVPFMQNSPLTPSVSNQCSKFALHHSKTTIPACSVRESDPRQHQKQGMTWPHSLLNKSRPFHAICGLKILENSHLTHLRCKINSVRPAHVSAGLKFEFSRRNRKQALEVRFS